ncbi:MAG: hypothetical protein H6765_10820 [Candidatus Peribacteria bacterium]|nr:MAG: hypothetical protein H6765_10820 [Candidatus Peribacteria bacterium]
MISINAEIELNFVQIRDEQSEFANISDTLNAHIISYLSALNGCDQDCLDSQRKTIETLISKSDKKEKAVKDRMYALRLSHAEGLKLVDETYLKVLRQTKIVDDSRPLYQEYTEVLDEFTTHQAFHTKLGLEEAVYDITALSLQASREMWTQLPK